MAGYYKNSMSNNAKYAYEDGERPRSKWTKADILSIAEDLIREEYAEAHFDFSLLKKVKAADLRDLLLAPSSWHHTSRWYNATDFFEVSAERLDDLTEQEVLRVIELEKAEKSQLKKEPKPEIWKCSFLEWSGTKKHPKATEITEVGEIKGSWFYRSNGSKKSTSAKGFRRLERIVD